MSTYLPRRAAGIGLGAVALALVAATVPAATATPTSAPSAVTLAATPTNSNVVIREVYNNGGSTGATYLNKYVELYNPTAGTISLSGWSLQYRSSTSVAAATGVTPLNGQIPAGSTYLIGGNSNAANGAPLPTPEVSDTSYAYSGSTGGQLILSSSTTPVAGDKATVNANAAVVDLLGYGTATTSETSPKANGYSTTASLNRTALGADTDNNSVDFVTGTPTPVACGTACDPGTDPPPDDDPTPATIAEIQGTGTASPLLDDTVVTEGVVAAAYPTGGFNGFAVQTEGTGGDPAADTTPGASDGVFVFTGSAPTVEIGDHVEVTAVVDEFFGLTELVPVTDGVVTLDTPAVAVKATTGAIPLTTTGREALESMLVAPTGPYTVTNNFATNQFGEIGLAIDSKPLLQPTNEARPGTQAYTDLVAYNAAHLITLDDGSTSNFLTTFKDSPVPWLTLENEVRTGAATTFTDPVILDFRNSLYKLQPTEQLVGADPAVQPVTFASTRTTAPQAVGGDVEIATFNVLNYFTTLGEDVAGCSSYKDRAGTPITVNTCPGNGPRGAWDQVSLDRQEAKIVSAINGLDADVVSLEEIENNLSVGDGERDVALSRLTDALNEAAGAGTWDYVESPSDLPDSEDVIRTAFIYKPDVVEPVGSSTILDVDAFSNARQPLAQEFQPLGASDDSAFVAIVNHFKSKGSGSGDDADMGDGQGASNASRVRQATALVDFASAQAAAAGTDRVFLTGDFNSYAQEDPLQVLEDAGYTNLVQTLSPDEETYQFSGLIGSLDHVFASPGALDDVTGAHVWDINADEALAREYSRYNYNATLLYDDGPYRASDHDPIVVGLDTDPAPIETEVSAVAARHAYGTPGTVDVTVTTSDDSVATGEVQLLDGDRRIGTAVLSDGQATIRLGGKVLPVGLSTLTVRYVGDGVVEGSETTVAVRVTKAPSTTTATKTAPATVVAGTSRARVAVRVTADNVVAEGRVEVRYAGAVIGSGTVANGSASVRLTAFPKVGKKSVTVVFLGSETVATSRTTLDIQVVRG